MNVLYRRLIEKLIRRGTLEVVSADGTTVIAGDGTGARIRIRFTAPDAERRVLLNPAMGLGEAYMEGGVAFEAGTIRDLITLLLVNHQALQKTPWMEALRRLRAASRVLAPFNNPLRSRQNVHSHYDLDGRLYSLFLDEDRQYSCAYFEPGVTDLDQAQTAKKRHIAAKLRIEPGMRVLDIGSGWGGLGLTLAGLDKSIDVTGVTLSDEQFTVSNQRAKEQGLDGRVRFFLKDYRAVAGPFDRIVSVGMFEHVGLKSYQEFFDAVARLLTDDGIALIHTIADRGLPGPINPWMQKYIFPGAYLPTIGELGPPIAKAGFWLTDLEIWRLHYAETLAAWHKRFQARRSEAAALYDERFCRMWEFYLQLCEAAFRAGDLMVFQMQLAKKIDAVPVTRDYMYRAQDLPPTKRRLELIR
jgi:cyclopropane-fatty-acyl-phospholipid synthase